MKDNTKIFTTGAFLQPIRIKDEDDKYFWAWIVESFEDDSYDGEEVFNPPEIASSIEQLLVNTTEEMD